MERRALVVLCICWYSCNQIGKIVIITCQKSSIYLFALYNSMNAALSSQPIPTLFILPICAMSAVHTSESVSGPSLVRRSLSKKDPEEGDSDGLRRRIEIFSDGRDVASLNMWGSGLRALEGIECDKEGDSAVGGSYLAHMMNTLNFLTGTSTPRNTSANLNRPLPLLVVHSGNTINGLSALARMSSKLKASEDKSEGCRGNRPVCLIMASNENSRKPKTSARGVGARVTGVDTAAEPVPVRRPGVRLIGEEVFDDEACSVSFVTATKKMGLNRNANHNNSIQDAQLLTMTSPALGVQGSVYLAPFTLLRVITSTGIHQSPTSSKTRRAITAVRTYVTVR